MASIGWLESKIKQLEADLCTHSIATRKADDDLAARIAKLESAHQATVPVDALRRLIEWAYIHQMSKPRDWDRLQSVLDTVMLWVPEVGKFTFSDMNGFYWQDRGTGEVE